MNSNWVKSFFMIVFILSLGLLLGCNAQNDTTSAPTENAPVQEETGQEVEKEEGEQGITLGGSEEEVALEPQEPGAEDKCDFCNMMVYPHDHEMGAFTAQMVTSDGEHLFFDDIGCLLNSMNEQEEEALATWVRDFNTLEWVDSAEAIPVHAQIKTPMKYGVALFADEVDAQAFIDENPTLEPKQISMADVAATAHERAQNKNKKMQEHQMQEHGMQEHDEKEMEHK